MILCLNTIKDILTCVMGLVLMWPNCGIQASQHSPEGKCPQNGT